ncbi:MAG: DUF2497 domain-containing protein [Alphaproteobacteria bacterium]|nr:DUF2497 domain-containing protein [Alphaproteobacteria bacterium]
MAEAKAKAGEQDQSMEEILQSIKRIIAEEGEAAPEKPAPEAEKPSAPFGSDVLELTDMMSDEPATTTPAADPFDALFAAEPAAEPSAPIIEPTPAIEPMPVEQSAFPAPAEEPSIIEDSLLSAQALEASASALRNLASMGSAGSAPAAAASGMSFRSGHTVEDLVVEALKPMLKEWLDANLPALVDRKVQREVERISRELRGE